MLTSEFSLWSGGPNLILGAYLICWKYAFSVVFLAWAFSCFFWSSRTWIFCGTLLLATLGVIGLGVPLMRPYGLVDGGGALSELAMPMVTAVRGTPSEGWLVAQSNPSPFWSLLVAAIAGFDAERLVSLYRWIPAVVQVVLAVTLFVWMSSLEPSGRARRWGVRWRSSPCSSSRIIVSASSRTTPTSGPKHFGSVPELHSPSACSSPSAPFWDAPVASGALLLPVSFSHLPPGQSTDRSSRGAGRNRLRGRTVAKRRKRDLENSRRIVAPPDPLCLGPCPIASLVVRDIPQLAPCVERFMRGDARPGVDLRLGGLRFRCDGPRRALSNRPICSWE